MQEVLIIDPKVLAVKIQENHEELIDLVSQTEIKLGPSPEIENNMDYTKLRKTVYEKLISAQKLLPKNIRFCLYEGYRSLALQEFLFESRKKLVEQNNPHKNSEEIFYETVKMVSPVINIDGSLNIPPHSTGAAVDVYLIDQNGKSLDMGIHPKDWLLDVEGILSKTHAINISPEAKKNRKIMSDVLSQVGFVNYFTEYWHWSYGDRYWAYQLGKPHAVYGVLS